MNIYVINEVLNEYTHGIAVIAASDLSECRAIFEDYFWPKALVQFDRAIKNGCYTVVPAGDGVQAGIISYVVGGGWQPTPG